MYVPRYQREEDEAVLWEAVERWSFGLIVTGGEPPAATLVPFLRRDGRLWMHLAAPNPQAKTLAEGGSVLCLFTGPHAYVSPTWYAEDHHVPTWNYVQIAVTGRPRPATPEETRWLLEETVREHGDDPAGPMAPTIDKLLTGMRAFEIDVDTVEGRFKLSQNKTEEDRRSVARQLAAQGGEAAGLAALMERFAL